MRIGKYYIHLMNTSASSMGSNVWSLSKNFRFRYRALEPWLFIGKRFQGLLLSWRLTIPYQVQLNKDWKRDREIHEKYLRNRAKEDLQARLLWEMIYNPDDEPLGFPHWFTDAARYFSSKKIKQIKQEVKQKLDSHGKTKL